MAKRIILAVAGAGKTYYICNSINKNEKNLILAFTNQNIRNIKKELVKAHDEVPEHTNVMTFDSFIYSYILRPYEPSVLKHFNKEAYVSKGITITDPPSRISGNGKNKYNNPYYVKDSEFGHYVSRGQYYCSRMSKLIMKTKVNKEKLINKVANDLNQFYDQIMIDEFQDFRKYDYDLIVALAKKIDNVLLVGDYYQHSVSGKNNSGKPFKAGKREIKYDEFLDKISKEGFNVDITSLSQSRRCPEEVCNFVRKKLGIEIASSNKNKGKVKIVDNNLEQILEDDDIIKLINMKSSYYSFEAINWAYSKGDTYKDICVILSSQFEDIDKDNFSCKGISTITIKKLYVAMTRTKGNLYIIKKSEFDKVKTKYLK